MALLKCLAKVVDQPTGQWHWVFFLGRQHLARERESVCDAGDLKYRRQVFLRLEKTNKLQNVLQWIKERSEVSGYLGRKASLDLFLLVKCPQAVNWITALANYVSLASWMAATAVSFLKQIWASFLYSLLAANMNFSLVGYDGIHYLATAMRLWVT